MTHTVAIVQARTGSTRLPGKVFMDIAGKPMLRHVIDRLKRSKLLDILVIATTTNEKDKPIMQLARESRVKSYAGSEDDVLDRYYQAATAFKADVIVRITSDCPLLDPKIVDKVIEHFLNGKYDYVSNTVPPTYPDGLDTEVFSYNALQRAWKEARLASEREHVTPYLRNHPEIFEIDCVKNDTDLSRLRWTVDSIEDLQFVRAVYRRLYDDGGIFYMEDILDLLQRYPELIEINKGGRRNEGYEKSLAEDNTIR